MQEIQSLMHLKIYVLQLIIVSHHWNTGIVESQK